MRYAACNALGQLSADFAPEFQRKYHSKVSGCERVHGVCVCVRTCVACMRVCMPECACEVL